MAERRMFAKTIIDSDAFLEMPISARLLYYDLAMRADDDGFINSPKKIMKFIGATNDDMNILIMRKFIIPFDNGVVVIKHWRIHNYIRKDTYNETPYKEEKAMLLLDENNAYTFGDGTPIKEYTKDKKPLTEARQKRLEAKKQSDLPYSFEYKIRNSFVGENCPICGCVMDNSNNLTKPTIQHNKPISKGGKHEISNISVICNQCNSSVRNSKETEPLNTDLVIEKWESIGNVSGTSTQVRLGKDSIVNINTCSNSLNECDENEQKISQNEQLRKDFDIIYKLYPKKVGKTKGFEHYKAWVTKGKVISGVRVRLTNRQIWDAVSKYKKEVDGKESQFIKQFDTFMCKAILDYVEDKND